MRDYCISRWPKKLGATHGVEHWDRVAMYGRMLYEGEADMDVIMAFAYLHDSERKDNREDKEHGLRASKLVDSIRESMLKHLTDEQIEKLKRACELHSTIKIRTGDITIDTCFDADRMVDFFHNKMATKRGKMLAADAERRVVYSKDDNIIQ